MKSEARWIVGLFALALATAGTTVAADWPQWQGPNRDGKSIEAGLLQQWPKDGPSLAWRVDDLGGGYSAPAIVDGRIYGMSSQGDDEVVWCRSEDDGKVIWTSRIGPASKGGMPQGSEGPGCTPTIDGDRLYVIGLGGELACLSLPDGKVLWHHHLVNDFGGIPPAWRYNESPLVDEAKVVCTPGGYEHTMVALDKMSGELMWKLSTPEPEPQPEPEASEEESEGRGRRSRGRGRFGSGPRSLAGYSSPIAIDFAGGKQYVQFLAKAVIGVDAETGDLLWEYKRPANNMGINCSTPLYKDGHVFAASAYGAGGGLVELNQAAGGEISTEEVYSTNKMQNHHGGMILVDGVLYGANGGNGGGFLRCLDFETGEDLWTVRDARKGALSFADERLYLYTEDGEVILIEPNRDEYVERGRFEQPDRSESPAWTHPVIANGRLYIRDQGLLLCYDISAGG